MFVKRSPARDTSEDSVLLLPRQKSEIMLGNEENSDGLKLSQRVAYGLGHIMNDICSAMWFSYTLLFFEVVLRMPSALAGLLICMGQIADAVASPIAGILIDRYGTRKSWHLLGTTLIAFSYSLVFSNCPWLPDIQSSCSNHTQDAPGSWENFSKTDIILGALYYIILVSVFQTGWAMVQIAHLAIIPEMTPDKTERANLTAIRYTATVCASVFVYLITWFILHLTEGNKSSLGPTDAYKFKDIILLGLLIGGICTILFHAILETPNALVPKDQSKRSFSSWIEVVKEYMKSLLLYQVTMLYFTSRMLLNISLMYVPLYLVEKVGQEAELLATVPLASYVASFVASLLLRQIRSYFSSKTNYLVGALLSVAASAWIGIGITSTVELFGMSILLGAGSSITSVASLCLCADLIGTDTDNGAFIYSVVTAVDKLLGGVIVILIENFKGQLSDGSSHYYQDVLAYGCGVSSILGLIVLITMYCNTGKLTQNRLQESSESVKD